MGRKAKMDIEETEGTSPRSLTEAVKDELKFNFNLEKFKEKKQLKSDIKFKEQEWIKLSPAFNNAISLPGIPHGHITIIRGHSDSGKTTAMIEAAKSIQEAGILPVLIITEMKWSMDRAIEMGFHAKKTVDANGSISYSGNFIYVDRDTLNTIEDVAAFIADLLDEQSKGNIPMDIAFLWDSVGSIPCQQSYDSGKNNAMWNAGAMATQFANFINQRIMMSRKASAKYTNSFIVVNKIRVEYPMNSPFEKPKMKNKGGDAMYWDASLVITFGNITNSGVSKIKAVKDKREVEFAKRTKVAVDKNHITEVTTTGRIVMTPHGFIEDDKKAIDGYKKEHSQEWLSILGSKDFDIVEEADLDEDLRDIPLEDQNED